MRYLLLAIVVLTAACSVSPAPLPAPIMAPVPVSAPIVLVPPVPAVVARPVPRDPRVKYTTEARCHYVAYDGRCLTRGIPSYRIPGR